MFRTKTIIFILVTLGILIAVKVLYLSGDPTNPAAQAPGKGGAGKPMEVNGIVISGSDLEENILASGTVMANESVELRPEIAGKIVSILFREGTPVKKGDLLVKLNDADFRTQLTKLESNRKLLIEKSERQKQLFELNGISRQEYDESLNQLEAVESDLSFTRAQIEKTEIRAPFDGQIGLKHVSEGSFVDQNFLIASMQQLNPVKIDFALPEKYSHQIKNGQELTFTTEGDNIIHTAKIYAIEPLVDAATRSVKIRALAENPGNAILPGAFARVKFSLNRSGEAILVPTQAIIPILKGKKVLVAKNGVALSQVITTGIRKNKEVEVLSGLAPGDTVITSGIMQLRDSMPVSVKVFDVIIEKQEVTDEKAGVADKN